MHRCSPISPAVYVFLARVLLDSVLFSFLFRVLDSNMFKILAAMIFMMVFLVPLCLRGDDGDVDVGERSVVSTLAGGVNGTNGAFFDASGSNAGFRNAVSVAVDASGTVFAADTENHRIRKVTAGGGTQIGIGPVNICARCADIDIAAPVRPSFMLLFFAFRLCFCRVGPFLSRLPLFHLRHCWAHDFASCLHDSVINMMVEISWRLCGRRWVGEANMVMVMAMVMVAAMLNCERAVVSTLAGGVNGTNVAYADGSGSNAGFNNPVGVAVDATGNVFVTDRLNQCIRKVMTEGGTRIDLVYLCACY
jgi:hypothetical protein